MKKGQGGDRERGRQRRECRDTGGTSLSYGNASLNLIKAA